MSEKFCHSCSMPLDIPGAKSLSEDYCVYCADETGELKPWDEIQEGVAAYLATWQPNITPEIALKRAERYLTSMPAWAHRVEDEDEE